MMLLFYTERATTFKMKIVDPYYDMTDRKMSCVFLPCLERMLVLTTNGGLYFHFYRVILSELNTHAHTNFFYNITSVVRSSLTFPTAIIMRFIFTRLPHDLLCRSGAVCPSKSRYWNENATFTTVMNLCRPRWILDKTEYWVTWMGLSCL